MDSQPPLDTENVEWENLFYSIIHMYIRLYLISDISTNQRPHPGHLKKIDLLLKQVLGTYIHNNYNSRVLDVGYTFPSEPSTSRHNRQAVNKTMTSHSDKPTRLDQCLHPRRLNWSIYGVRIASQDQTNTI